MVARDTDSIASRCIILIVTLKCIVSIYRVSILICVYLYVNQLKNAYI